MLLAERGLVRQLGKLKLSKRTKWSVWTLINGGYGGGRAIPSELLKMADFSCTATMGVILNLEVIQVQLLRQCKRQTQWVPQGTHRGIGAFELRKCR